MLALKFTQVQSFLRHGNLQAAKTLLLHICGVSREISGVSHPATLLYLDCLAATLVRLEHRAAATSIVSELLEFRTGSTETSEYSTTLATASVLVTHLLNAGDWYAALPMQERTVALLGRRRGQNDVETLAASSLYAMILVECGRLIEARPLLQTISSRFAAVLGHGHGQTLTAYLLLGTVMSRLGDYASARSTMECSYFAAKNGDLQDPVALIRLGTRLGAVLLNLKDYPAAQSLLSDLLNTCEQMGEKDNLSTLANLNNLALASWELGNFEEGLKMQEELVRRRKRKYGNEHAATLESMTTLVLMHARFDRLQERSRIPARLSERHGFACAGPSADSSKCIFASGAQVMIRLHGFRMPT